MKRETLEFIRGERNATLDNVLLSRERANNGDLIFVSLPELKNPLYKFWHSRKKKIDYEIEYSAKSGDVKHKKLLPKGTGGKVSYVMLMPVAISELGCLTIDSAGVLFKLMDSIEWNTGRICRQRDGKSLTKDMIADKCGIGKRRIKSCLRELGDLNIITYNNNARAYYFNNKYIRKGATVDEDKI